MFMSFMKFQFKQHLKKVSILLAVVITLIFTCFSMLRYFEHYQLNNENDIEYIHNKISTDAEVPVSGEKRLELVLSNISKLLTNNKYVKNTSEIIEELKDILYKKTDWSTSELDEIWSTLKEKYESLNFLPTNQLSNSYISNSRTYVTQNELKNHMIASNKSFSELLATEYGQILALIICVMFIGIFAFDFSYETKPALYDVLHTKAISPRKYIYGKSLSLFIISVLCIFLNNILMNIFQLFMVPNVIFDDLWAIWSIGLFYVLPTLFFIAMIAMLLSILFKNGFISIAALFIFYFLSSNIYYLPDGTRIQNLFTASFIFNLYSFYDRISDSRLMGIIINRISLLGISILIAELTVLIWKNKFSFKFIQKRKKIFTKGFNFRFIKRNGFIFYNTKIILNPVTLFAVFAVFCMEFIMISSNSEISTIGRSILLIGGWGAIILFSNVKSVEYTNGTIDEYRLSKKSKISIILLRLLICSLVIIFAVLLTFILCLLKLNPQHIILRDVFDTLFKTIVTSLVCSIFLGTVTMIFGDFFKNAWVGIGLGFLVNSFLSSIRGLSMFNLYVYFYDVRGAGVNSILWIKSGIFFFTSSIILLTVYDFLISKRERIYS